MQARRVHWIVLAAVVAAVGCGKSDQPPAATPQAQPAPAGTGVGSGAPAPEAAPPMAEAAAPAEAAEPPAAASPEAPAAAAPIAPAGPAPAAVLAVQETKWPGLVAELTEFRRKGSTLTAKVRFRNTGSEDANPDVYLKEVYLMDLAAGKKYEALRDQEGTYIGSLRQGWDDRWYETVKPGQTMTIWVKFPAPPPEVRAMTLQVPGVQPFEDVPIQEG